MERDKVKQVFEIEVDDLKLRPMLLQALLRDYFQKLKHPVKTITVNEIHSNNSTL
jgi:hypothetical protein